MKPPENGFSKVRESLPYPSLCECPQGWSGETLLSLFSHSSHVALGLRASMVSFLRLSRRRLIHKLHTIEFFTTLSNGCLGSGNDEERCEMRYVMRIAELSESSNF